MKTRKITALLTGISMLLTGLGVSMTAEASDAGSSEKIVNGDFEYHPNWSTVTTRTSARYTNIDPVNGAYIKNAGQGEGNVSWEKWQGFDFGKFGWQSDQEGINGQGGIQDRAKAVELQLDDNGKNTYAELVASEQDKAIYQNIETIPGATYKVKLKHASLSKNDVDTMQVVINSTPITMTRIVSNGHGDKTGVSSTTIATKVTNESNYDHDGQWETYEGVYTIPAGQTSTRFGFKATSATAADPSRGNIVDDISFAIIYNINYDKNASDASGTTANQTCYQGSRFNTRASGFTRTNYTFAGWNTKADGSGTACTEGESVKPNGNMTLYAQWKRITYNVTYDKNSSAATGTMNKQTFNAGDNVTLTKNKFTRTGYHFTGWKTQANSGTAYTDGATVSKPSGNFTLYAQWEANKYKVRFWPNPQKSMTGHGLMSDQQFTFDQAQNLTANKFTADGYTFTGWNTKMDGSGTAYTDKQQVKNLTTVNNGVVDLFAQWKANPTSISFKPNGGTGTTPPVNGLVGDECKLTLNGYTRDGYTFTGWNTSTDGSGTAYADGATITCPVTPMTVHAQWTANASKLSYNANGGTGTMDDTEGVTDQQVTVSDNKYSRDGYEFTGWNTKPDGTGDNITAGSEFTLKPQPTVVYAQWKALPSAITYDKNREDATGSTPDTTGVTDQTVNVNENGYKVTGWSFTGWNTKPDGSGDTIKPGDEFTLKPQPTSVYAQWTPDPATVRYDPNGGNGDTPGYDGHTGDTPDTNNNQFKPADGCSTFTGWNTKQDGTGVSYKPGDKLPALLGELVLYAQWDDTSCPATVTYDPNGGDGETPPYEGHLHDTPNAANNGFTGNGCDEFKGWNTEKDGSGTTYREGEQLPELTGNVTLYAQWEPKDCPITPATPAAPLAKTGSIINSIALIGATLIAVAAGLLIAAHQRKQRDR